MVREHQCGMPCVRTDCKRVCDWVPDHNVDDGLHLCWEHIKEYEDELYSGYRGMDCD